MARRTKRTPKEPYRSMFEEKIAGELNALGEEFEYEPYYYEYEAKVPRAFCGSCNSSGCYTLRKYTPDFYIPAMGLTIESKGKFTAADRAKHVSVKRCHPDLNVHFIFQRNNKLSRKSKSRYSDWCEKHGFTYAINEVPKEWITKP